MGKHSQYGVILDAGSSGTRLYVYKWKTPDAAAKGASALELKNLPKIKLEKSKKVHPGVSSFAKNVASIGKEHLQPLVDVALDEIPHDKIHETPIFLMATAGVRLLPQNEQSALLQGICTYLKGSTKFILPDCETNIQVISGETEGLYGWIAANYLLGGFDYPEKHNHGKNHHTYGFLDMGGASAQIAFAPNATESKKHWDDLKLVRMRNLDGSPAEHKVFTATWLGFGANKARERFVEHLQESYSDNALELPDPCLPIGLRTSLTGKAVEGKKSSKEPVLVGTGRFEECLRETYPLLRKDAPCEDHPCLVNGQHAPAIDFDVNHFVGVSEYWHTTHGVFGKKHKAYDLATYQTRVMEFCSKEWADIESDLGKREKTPDHKLEDARDACFKASWLINMLYDGIGIPRVGIDGGNSHGINGTGKGDEKNIDDPFKPVDSVDGVELSWTLGKMVLYASGQIPPKGENLPVGFGTNVLSGTPKDFEYAGSVPLPSDSSKHHDDDDDDFDDILKKSPTSVSGLAIFIILLLVIFFFLRKAEWRKRMFGLIRRRRRSGNSRKPSRGFFLTNKLFGRSHQSYERVMEEGDAAEFELCDVDSDENDYSDSSDGSRVGRASGLATPQLTIGRFDEHRPPSAMDRAGLVVRTESRDRLAPTVQMLNAGRRSRNGSPTRAKSPFMTPLQED